MAKSTADEMLEIKVVSSAGKKASTEQIPAALLSLAASPSVLHQSVRWQRNKKRAGTHTVLTRAETRGGGAKPWKQKGTGRARAGSNTSPLWVGGGIPHGPKQRSYEFSRNKKERLVSLRYALGVRHREERLIVVDDFKLKEIKTKRAQEVLQAVGITRGDNVLAVVAWADDTVRRSLRNIDGVKVVGPEAVNVLDIINSKFVIVVGPAFRALVDRLTGKTKN